jgi:hypothetical protein
MERLPTLTPAIAPVAPEQVEEPGEKTLAQLDGIDVEKESQHQHSNDHNQGNHEHAPAHLDLHCDGRNLGQPDEYRLGWERGTTSHLLPLALLPKTGSAETIFRDAAERLPEIRELTTSPGKKLSVSKY